MPSFRDLPREIVLLISEHLHKTKDLSAFSRTCNGLYALLINALYQLGLKKQQNCLVVPFYPVYITAWAGHPNAVKLFLDNGGDVNEALISPPGLPYLGNTMPIHAPLISHSFDMPYLRPSRPLVLCTSPAPVTKLLVERGADVNMPLSVGITPLALAILGAYDEIDHFEEWDDRTVHWKRVHDGYLEAMRILLAAGADVNTRSFLATCGPVPFAKENKRSPLCIALYYGSAAMLLLLIEHGADLSERFDEFGRNILHFLAANDDLYRFSGEEKLELMKACVRKGLDIREVDATGQTAAELFESPFNRNADLSGLMRRKLLRGEKMSLVDGLDNKVGSD